MLKRKTNIKVSRKGQSLIEYTVVIGVIAMVLFAMQPMVKRATQGMFKSMADQIGTQQNAEQDFADPEGSHLDYSYTTTRARIDKTRLESGGVINYVYGDMVNTEMTSATNLGFSPEN